MAPLKVFMDAGKHAAEKEGMSVKALTEIQLVEKAIAYLGLDELTPFHINEKVLEYKLASQ